MHDAKTVERMCVCGEATVGPLQYSTVGGEIPFDTFKTIRR